MKLPHGFRYAAAKAGIKPGRVDLALIVSDSPCATAGAFTVNRLCAAPVKHASGLLPADGVRAIVANSGNANAMTGRQGEIDERAVAAAVGAALGISAVDVLSASTGSIGPRLPVEKIAVALPEIVKALGEDQASFEAAAEAIRTTDLTPKSAFRVLDIGGKAVTLAAMAKGAGMIHPQMATMLCFVTTDAAISPRLLDALVVHAADETFNQITVDGDMSTNDSVIVMANGRSGAPLIEEGSAEESRFRLELKGLLGELARMIAEDGEGATKLLVVDVLGAPEKEMARDLARSVAGSSLVKAGMFGGDPSWGRVMASLGARIGSRGYVVDLSRLSLEIQGHRVYDTTGPVPFDKAALNTRMLEKEIQVRLNLDVGPIEARALGCDLSYDYVRINADYAGAIAAGPTAPSANVAFATGLLGATNRGLVVEALSYIRKFAGHRAVIKYGGAAMVDPALKRSFCEEVLLLHAAGLRPIIVHGGGPEISKLLERLGHKSTFADGQRITGADDVRVVEMVLTGQVNTEIVGMLNTLGGNAVGLSGKDGRLLRARKLQPKAGKPDLGFVGEVVGVDTGLVDLLLEKRYIPVISPVGMGDDGTSYNINADVVAAEIAVATKADKLLYLTDVAGVLDENGKLISEIRGEALKAELAASETGGPIRGGMVVKVQGILRALEGGVGAVHVVDGRQRHSLVAELFTDKGVGTLITP
jgi:acetylglutamate kinase